MWCAIEGARAQRQVCAESEPMCYAAWAWVTCVGMWCECMCAKKGVGRGERLRGCFCKSARTHVKHAGFWWDKCVPGRNPCVMQPVCSVRDGKDFVSRCELFCGSAEHQFNDKAKKLK